MLQWNLSPIVTAKAGTINFAISVIGTNMLEGEEIPYVWQTFPSSFTVSQNLTKG
jgi:hypothetical protein